MSNNATKFTANRLRPLTYKHELSRNSEVCFTESLKAVENNLQQLQEKKVK